MKIHRNLNKSTWSLINLYKSSKTIAFATKCVRLHQNDPSASKKKLLHAMYCIYMCISVHIYLYIYLIIIYIYVFICICMQNNTFCVQMHASRCNHIHFLAHACYITHLHAKCCISRKNINVRCANKKLWDPSPCSRSQDPIIS